MTINEKMLEVIRKIALAKKEAQKACNQIAAYEYEQQIKKLTDELVVLYEESEQQPASINEEELDLIATQSGKNYTHSNKMFFSYRFYVDGFKAGFRKAIVLIYKEDL